MGGLAVQEGDGDEDASHAAEGNSPEQASAAEQRDGPPSSKRRSPRAPLGLVFKEEEECQSRGVWDAVKAGLVAPGSVSEGLREYCRVEVLDGDNMYACDQCSRQFREQGRKGMEEARQRRRSREAKGSSTEEEEAEDDEEDSKRKEEAVRAEVKSPALKQTLLWALPRFLVLNLKRFTQTVRGRMRKNDKFVKFPIRLDLSPFCHRAAPVLCFQKSAPTVENSGAILTAGSFAGGERGVRPVRARGTSRKPWWRALRCLLDGPRASPRKCLCQRGCRDG